MIQGVDFVHESKLFEQGLLRDKEGENPQLVGFPKDFDFLFFIFILSDEMKVNVTEINNKEIKILGIIVLKSSFDHLIILNGSIVTAPDL
jgi:hypothetical protein